VHPYNTRTDRHTALGFACQCKTCKLTGTKAADSDNMPGLLRQIIAKATAYRSRYFQSAASELGFSMETAEKLRTDSETSHIVTDSMIAQGHAMEMNLYLTDVAVM